MAESNKHKEQIEDTGCSYGYFTITKAKEQDTEAFLNCTFLRNKKAALPAAFLIYGQYWIVTGTFLLCQTVTGVVGIL